MDTDKDGFVTREELLSRTHKMKQTGQVAHDDDEDHSTDQFFNHVRPTQHHPHPIPNLIPIPTFTLYCTL